MSGKDQWRLVFGIAMAVSPLILSFSVAVAWAEPPEIHEAPFQFEKRQIVVEVSVEGKGPFPMHIDSAVILSAMDETVAEAAQLQTGGTAGYVGGFGSKRIPYRNATLGSVTIGDFRVTDVPTIVWDSSHLKIDGMPLLGILGESFFRRAWVQIDYPKRVLRLVSNDDRASGHPPDCSETGEVLPVDIAGVNVMLRDVKIEGQAVTAVLDTGASGGVHLPLSQARRMGLGDKWDSGERIEAYGARGAFEARKTKVESVTLGGFEVADVDTVISPNANQILIGNGFFQTFVLTIDRHMGRVCLSRPSEESSAER